MRAPAPQAFTDPERDPMQAELFENPPEPCIILCLIISY